MDHQGETRAAADAADADEDSSRRDVRRRFFRERAADFERAWSKADHRALIYANIRLALFLAAVALAFGVWRGWLPSQLVWGELALAALFLAVAGVHDRVIHEAERLKLMGAINERAALRLERDFEHLETRELRPKETLSAAGAAGLSAASVQGVSPTAQDLGIAGSHSLMFLLDDTFTKLGRAALVRLLETPEDGSRGARARQEAVRELTERTEFRELLEAEGRLACPSRGGFDVDGLAAWGSAAQGRFAQMWRWPARILPPVTIALWMLWDAHLVKLPLWVPLLVFQTILASVFRGRSEGLWKLAKAGGEARLGDFRRVFELVSSAPFSSGRLSSLAEQMRSCGRSPADEIELLSRLLSCLRLRSQPLLHVPLAILFLWEVHLTDALEAWHERCGGKLKSWFEALAEVEALSSLAGYAAMEGDDACWPEISDAPELSAEALGHPLIPGDKRVANSARLRAAVHADGTGGGSSADAEISKEAADVPAVLLVTGSNMAGKTTFLRTLGINACLALAGAPVCARRMRIGAVRVVSSMRVEDSLGDGLSLFHSEVLRMKGVLDAAAAGPTLFLLDEILHGTNTAERQKASRAIVRALVQRGAMGAVATHDLSLASLENETGGAVRNVHFTDSLKDGALSFDYRLHGGVVSTTNALQVLRQAGIDLPGMED